jgi:hypothetical protein
MGDALRRLFLSIGVGLGLASGQPDPSMLARVDLVGDALAVSARVENAFAPGALELVEAGTRVALRFSAQVETREGAAPARVEEIRAIWYDLRSGLYCVSFGGSKTATLVDPEAARNLASSLSDLELCRDGDAATGARVAVRAEVGIIDSRGLWHDAPVLWNYRVPRVLLPPGGR